MAIPNLTNNTPSSGYITWPSFHIVYNGVDYAVSGSNTNLVYTWWQYNAGSPTVVSSNTFPSTLTANDQILFLNKNGIGVYVGNTNLLDGSLIVPQSIIAGALAANSVDTINLKAMSVNASKLSIGDLNNYIEDANFANTLGISWILTAGTNWAISTAGLPTIDRYLSKVGGTTGQVLNNLVLLTRQGDYLSVSGLSFNQSSAGVQVGVAWYDNAGAFVSKDMLVLGGAQTDWTTFEKQVQAPGGAFYAVFVWEHDGVGTSRLANPSFLRRMTGSLIVDGTIKSQHLSTDALDAKTMTGVSLNIGSYIRLNPSEGLYVGRADGGFIQFPSDGTTDATVQAKLVANSLTMKGDGQFYGTSLLSGTFKGSKGVPDPSTAPTITNTLVRSSATIGGIHGVTDNAAGTHWLVLSHSDAIAGGAPAFNRLIWLNKSTLANDSVLTLTNNSTDLRVLRTSAGLYAVDLIGGVWKCAPITSTGVGNATIGTFVTMAGVTPTVPRLSYSWGSDGTLLLYAESFSGSATVTVQRNDPSTNTGSSTVTLTGNPFWTSGATLKGVMTGSFDYGSTRWILSDGVTAYTWNSTPTYQSTEFFPLDTTGANDAIIFDGTRFLSFSNGMLTSYSTNNANTIVYARYAWEDANATGGFHHTIASPYSQITRVKRAYLQVQGLPAPMTTTGTDDINMVRIYVGTSSASTNEFLQTNQPALGATTAVYDSLLASGTTAPTTNNVSVAFIGSFESETLTAGTQGWQFKGDGSLSIGTYQQAASGAQTLGKYLGDTGWIDMTLTNSWVNYDSGLATGGTGRACQYRRINGVVHFRGVMRSGTLGATFFTMPAGFRVATRTTVDAVFPVQIAPGIGFVSVDGSGVMSINSTAANTYTYLDGIQYVADQ